MGHSTAAVPNRKWAGAAVGLALVFPTVMTWLYFVELATPDGTGPNPALQAVYSGGKVLQFAFPVIVVVALERRWPRPGRATTRGLALGAGFALLVALATFVLFFGFLRDSALFARTPAMLRAKVAEFGLATPLGFIALGTFLSVIHALAEEYYWRWFVFGYLRQLLPLWPAIVISSLGFMAHHVVVLAVYFPGQFLTAALPFSLGVAVGGGFWAWLYQRSGSIWGPWLSHALVDTAIMVVGYVMLFS